jgi:hypothetical protein
MSLPPDPAVKEAARLLGARLSVWEYARIVDIDEHTEAIAAMLADGWEPFAAVAVPMTASGAVAHLYLRRQCPAGQ